MAERQTLMELVTSVGRRLYSPDTSIYVGLGGRAFVKKRVGDLKEGERILWNEESVDADLENLEPYLSKSQRYADAEKMLFVDVEGGKMPRLQYELLKASTRMGLIEEATLEELLQQGSIPASAIADSVKYINEKYSELHSTDGLPKRTESAIRSWLNGTTISPIEHDIFLGLAYVLEHEPFMDWYTAAERDPIDINSFFGASRFHATVRQQIPKYFSKHYIKTLLQEKAGEETGEIPEGDPNKEYRKKPGFNLAPELSLVLSEFMDRVDEELLSVTVSEVKPLGELKEGNSRGKRPNPGLKDGAYTGEAKENMNVKDFVGVFTDYSVFRETYRCLVQEWLSGIQEGRYETDDPLIKDFLQQQTQQNLSNKIFPFTHPNTIDLSYGYRRGDDVGNLRQELDEAIYQKILSGSIDEAFGMDKFTTYRLVESTRAIRSSFPDVFSEYYQAALEYSEATYLLEHRSALTRYEKQGISSREWRAKTKRNNLAEKMYADYAIIVEDLARAEMLKPVIDDLLTDKGIYNTDRIESTVDSFRSILDERDLNTFSGLTRKTCIDSLQSYGLEQAFPFIDQRNFVLDNEPVPESSQNSRMRLNYGNNS